MDHLKIITCQYYFSTYIFVVFKLCRLFKTLLSVSDGDQGEAENGTFRHWENMTPSDTHLMKHFLEQ